MKATAWHFILSIHEKKRNSKRNILQKTIMGKINATFGNIDN